MTDYGDRGLHPELNSLSLDHEELLKVTGELMRACAAVPIDDREIDALLEQLDVLHARHARREERGLFAALRGIRLPDDYLHRFEHDHSGIEKTLGDAQRDHAAVPELVRRLEAHIRTEESDMFPAAHQLLSPSNWDDIEQAVGAPRTA